MPTTPPSITALPTPPDPNDRATFNTRAYPWSVAQQTLATEANAVASNVYANASEAASSANSAAISVLDAIAQVTLANAAASSAEATAGATQWASGATYAIGDCVWSPLNQQTYRRKVAGAGTTDPSADTANWTQVGGGSSKILRSARTSNSQLTTADNGKLIDITSGTFTQTFAAAATLGDGWFCYLKNSGNGDITLDPNASETIDGLTSYIMYPGEVRLLQCDGVALRSVVLSGFLKTFVASGNFIKPPCYSAFSGVIHGAGGGGGGGRGVGSSNSGGSGGGGGGYSTFTIAAATFSGTETITVGAGGAGGNGTASGDGGGGSAGGATSLGVHLRVAGARGGGGGLQGTVAGGVGAPGWPDVIDNQGYSGGTASFNSAPAADTSKRAGSGGGSGQGTDSGAASSGGSVGGLTTGVPTAIAGGSPGAGGGGAGGIGASCTFWTGGTGGGGGGAASGAPGGAGGAGGIGGGGGGGGGGAVNSTGGNGGNGGSAAIIIMGII